MTGKIVKRKSSWVAKEADRLKEDLLGLIRDIGVLERRYQVQMSDKDQTVVLGANEWKLFKDRITDSCKDMIANLDDFANNDYHRQLHWSALRLLTASGVLNTELNAYREKLDYISRHPSDTSADADILVNWFSSNVEPLCGRMSARLVQIMSRVMDPSSWDISSTLTDMSTGENGSVTLTMRFETISEDRARKERERIKRMQRLDLED